MNKDKIMKDLKKRNDSLKMQYEYRNIRCIHLEKENERLQQENQQLKKQKDDVAQYIKEIKKHREEGLTITEYKAKWRSMFDYLESDEIINNLLRMLGEIDG